LNSQIWKFTEYDSYIIIHCCKLHFRFHSSHLSKTVRNCPRIREYPCDCLDCQSVIHPLNVESLLNRKAATGSSYGSFYRACQARILEILKDLEIHPIELLNSCFVLWTFLQKRSFLAILLIHPYLDIVELQPSKMKMVQSQYSEWDSKRTHLPEMISDHLFIVIIKKCLFWPLFSLFYHFWRQEKPILFFIWF